MKDFLAQMKCQLAQKQSTGHNTKISDLENHIITYSEPTIYWSLVKPSNDVFWGYYLLVPGVIIAKYQVTIYRKRLLG